MSNQTGWRWCYKCQGLFFSGNPSQGKCPTGGPHDASQSGPTQSARYAPLVGNGIPGAQDGWRWCQKCQGLFFSLNPSLGVCPADYSEHDGRASGHYVVQFGDAVPWTQGLWRGFKSIGRLNGGPVINQHLSCRAHSLDLRGRTWLPWRDLLQ